jgi:hypothetical protein
MADPAAAAKLLQAGAEPRSSSPQELAALVKSNKIGLAEARSKAKVPEAFNG